MSPPARPTPPRLLTIAGSDSGGGAGIQADLKTFAAHGAYGMSALTAVTAQNTLSVTAMTVLSPRLVAAQIDAVLEDLGADAIKVGMLADAATVRAVADRLRAYLEGHPGIPIVVDPVMIAKSGASLLADGAIDALKAELLPLATVVAPNVPELERLTGLPPGAIEGEEARKSAALRLVEEIGEPRLAVLAKGGHAAGEEIVDLLVSGGTLHRFAHPRLPGTSTHGTGCTLSSAIAARLGRGEPLPRAVSGAIEYLVGAIAAAYPLGSGHGPVDHLYLARRDA